MHVSFKIVADGQDVTSNFQDRLISLTIIDEAGQKSDTAEISIDDRDYLVDLPDADEATVDNLRQIEGFDPDTKLDLTAVEYYIDPNPGSVGMARLSVPIGKSVLFPENPERMPPTAMEANDAWAGSYAPGTILQDPAGPIGVATNLQDYHMGTMLVAAADFTLTIREQANHAIPRSLGQLIAFGIWAEGGIVTVAGEAGVTLSGNLVIPQGAFGWIISRLDDNWRVSQL